MEGKYSDELFDSICNELASSNRGLKHICKDHGISSVAFYAWLQDNEKTEDKTLVNKYVRAREAQADYLADEIIEIADDSTHDTITKEIGGEAVEMENKEWTNRSKLRVDARKWVASKLKPKRYGDKLDLTSDGKELPTPNVITIFQLPDNGRNESTDTTAEG